MNKRGLACGEAESVMEDSSTNSSQVQLWLVISANKLLANWRQEVVGLHLEYIPQVVEMSIINSLPLGVALSEKQLAEKVILDVVNGEISLHFHHEVFSWSVGYFGQRQVWWSAGWQGPNGVLLLLHTPKSETCIFFRCAVSTRSRIGVSLFWLML